MQRFEAPAVFHQLSRQPIQQFRMARFGAAGTKVVGRRDDAGSEMMLPQPIHDRAGGQRISRIRDPRGQLSSPFRFRRVWLQPEVGGRLFNSGERAGRDDVRRRFYVARFRTASAPVPCAPAYGAAEESTSIFRGLARSASNRFFLARASVSAASNSWAVTKAGGFDLLNISLDRCDSRSDLGDTL